MVYATADGTPDGASPGKLRVGMVGGGRNAFIGAVHRFAMRLDDRIDLVAGALSADPGNAKASAAELGIAPDRSYGDFREMAQAEARRADGIEAVAIVTPNHLHAPVATAFLEAGIDVICDKPLAVSLPEALALLALTQAKNRKLVVTLNNTGNAMVRQAREMVSGGEIGSRVVALHASYFQDWLTLPVDAQGHKQAEWRTDPARAGQSAVLADIGVHAYSLASFVAGCEASEVSADLFTAVPGRRLDDNANVMVRWSNGARGTVLASQTAPGNYGDLSLRVYGDKGGLEWRAGRPEELRFTRYGAETQILVRGGHGASSASRRVSRMPAAHPEGYIEAFANLYGDAAAIIRAHRSGAAPDPALAGLVPDIRDGVRGVKFVAAAVASNANGGRWEPAGLD